MEELMKTKIFKVTVERLLLNGGQTLYMVGWSLLIGTIIGMILALILVLCRKGGLVENRPLYVSSLYTLNSKLFTYQATPEDWDKENSSHRHLSHLWGAYPGSCPLSRPSPSGYTHGWYPA